MPHLILLLVLVSACAHATWNLIAKRVAGGLAFQELFTLASTLIYAPLAAVLIWLGQERGGDLFFVLMVGTALLHLVYFALLNRGYQVGDLSLVYPLARGSGPMIATAFAIVLYGERPSALALGGVALIGGGTLLLTGRPGALLRSGNAPAVVFALLTGCAIAAYTLWDKEAVGRVGLDPIVYYWGGTTLEGLLLAPVVLRSAKARAATGAMLRRHWRAALGVGFLSPLAYFLVLIALSRAPVYDVAPVREIGILIGVFLGTQVLAEGQAWRRLLAAGMMLGGVVVLAVA